MKALYAAREAQPWPKPCWAPYKQSAVFNQHKTSTRHTHNARVASRPSGSVTKPIAAASAAGPGAAATSTKKEKTNLLTSILSFSSVPYSSYVPEPKTFLHRATAETKQLWIIAVLLLMSRASTPVRLFASALIAAATALALPPRIWKPQLLRLGALTAIIFVFTAMSEGVPPLLINRIPPTDPAAAAAALDTLPSTMAEVAPKAYRYVVFHLGPITITKRSINLAVALSTVTFAALQSASLCLVTTPPERMAAAVGKALTPFGWIGVPIKELVLTVLLALRFMATVFEECRNLCLGLASRGINWGQLGFRGTVSIVIGMGARLFGNLLARCESIAQAMSARGFRGPMDHVLHVDGGAPSVKFGLSDALLLLSLAGLAGLSYILV